MANKRIRSIEGPPWHRPPTPYPFACLPLQASTPGPYAIAAAPGGCRSSDVTPASASSKQSPSAGSALSDPSGELTTLLTAVKHRSLHLITNTLTCLQQPPQPVREHVAFTESACTEITSLFERLFLVNERLDLQVHEKCMEAARQETIARVYAVLLL